MALRNKTGRLRTKKKTEDFSPMEGLGNMADAMLVFACGLIRALIISWNVNVSEQGEIQNMDNRYEVDGYEDNATVDIGTGETMEEIGTVYRDPATGRYYVVEDEY